MATPLRIESTELIVDKGPHWADGFRVERRDAPGGTPLIYLSAFSRNGENERAETLHGMAPDTARAIAALLVEQADALEDEHG